MTELYLSLCKDGCFSMTKTIDGKCGKCGAVKAKKLCQFCGTETSVQEWVPAGCICRKCKKALDRIRKEKLGFGWLPK